MPEKKTFPGTFEVKNNLLYYLPGKGDSLDVDHALKVEGDWNITKNGKLCFLVKHTQSALLGKAITVGTRLIRAKAGVVEFQAQHRINKSGKSIKTVTLEGNLSALPGKQLAFELEHSGRINTLQLNGTWDIFANNQIGCLIKRTLDGKETKNLVVLKGTWRFFGNTVAYQLDDPFRPFFQREFTVKRAVYTNKESSMDLALGASLREKVTRRGRTDTVSLKGVWRQDGVRAEFIFDIAKKQSVTFILSKKLSSDTELVFELEAGDKRKPSFSVVLDKKIKGDSSFFVRGTICGNDKRVEAGFYFPF